MHNIETFLSKLGLNHFEKKIYLSLLESGEKPASQIAKQTDIPRSTTRGILDRLCEKRIIGKIYKRNTQYYSCKPPEALKTYLLDNILWANNCLSDFKELLPTFETLYERENIIPKIQYFEGPKQVTEAFNHCLYTGVNEILIFTSYQFLKTPTIKKNDDKFIKMRVKKGIHARILVGNTTAKEKMIQKSPGELRERRLMPKKYELPGNIHIYGNSCMYFSASEGQYNAILIENTMMAQTLRVLFQFMWEHCK